MKRRRQDGGAAAAAPKRKKARAPAPAAAAARAARAAVSKAAELKVKDIDAAVYQVNTTGSITLLNGLTKGDDIGNREGRKVTVKSIFIRGMVYPEQGTTAIVAGGAETLNQLLRMIIFVDYQPVTATAVTLTDVLKEASSYSQLNINNRTRFRVLHDETFTVPNSFKAFTAATGAVGNIGGAHEVKVYKKVDIPVTFNSGDAGTFADIQNGAIYMLWVGSAAAGTTDCNATLSTRVRFTDL